MLRKSNYVRRIVDSGSDNEDVRDDQTNSLVSMEQSSEKSQATTHSNIDVLPSAGSSNSHPTGHDANSSSSDETRSPSYSSGSPSTVPSTPDTTPETTPCKRKGQESLNRANAERIQRMEEMIANINTALMHIQTPPVKRVEADPRTDESWKLSNEVSIHGSRVNAGIRWDHLKPFPPGVAANKMWEEWNRYVENFEIAASLSNVLDPVKRTQLLYLSMGTELQGIVNAAKLRPSLLSASCYSTFVSNIEKYLKSMTDTAAEHEAFSRMVQAIDESAVSFHARLMGKVRSCNYSVEDEDRFVRAQLLAGLRNRELVKQARTFGYETNFIVQSATRNEAFESEGRRREEPSILQIRSGQGRPYYQQNHKRNRVGNRNEEPYAKHQRITDSERQWPPGCRCPKCFLYRHRNRKCPALDRECRKCGKRGHYSAVCRQQQHINSMHSQRIHEIPSKELDSPDDEKQDHKQVFDD